MGEILHQYRFVAVVALLGIAAVLAMEKGRLPLALRGIRKVMGRDAGSGETPRGEAEAVRLKLLEHPLTRSVDVFDDDEVHAIVEGTDAEVSRVVGTVFAANRTVLSFNRNQMGLEELFMKITQGKVQ